MRDKVAFITGGGSGIGQAAATVLARRGVKVALAGRTAEELVEVAEGIGRSGGSALTVAGLLLAVLVFISLTRGSRTQHVHAAAAASSSSSVLRGVPGGTSVREWGRRNLSFSGDWVSRLRSRSRSLTASPGGGTGTSTTTPVARGAGDPQGTHARPSSSSSSSSCIPPREQR